MGKLLKRTTINCVMTKDVVVHEPRLSLKAKGVYTLLISLPEYWEFSVKSLCTFCKDGRDSVSTALRELEEAGLLRRLMKDKDESGKIEGYDYVIFDNPFPSEPIVSDLPLTENPSTAESNNSCSSNELNKETVTENPSTVLREERKSDKEKRESKEKKEINKFISKKKKNSVRENPPDFEEVEAYIHDNNLNLDARHFYEHHSDPGCNWTKADGEPIFDWKLAARTWSRNQNKWDKGRKEVRKDYQDSINRYQGGGEESSYTGPKYCEDDEFPF